MYTHVPNDNVMKTNEQVNDKQNGIQKEVLGLSELYPIVTRINSITVTR